MSRCVLGVLLGINSVALSFTLEIKKSVFTAYELPSKVTECYM